MIWDSLVKKGRHDGTAVIWRNIWLDLGGEKCQIEIKFIKLKPTKVQVDPSKIRTSSSRINFIILCNLGMVWKFYFIYLNGKKPKKNLASEDMCRPVFTGQNNSLHYILHISLNNCLYNSPHNSLQNSLHNSILAYLHVRAYFHTCILAYMCILAYLAIRFRIQNCTKIH